MAEADSPDVPPAPVPETPAPVRVYRHRLPTRIWHWVNAVTLLVMLMSGLMIFNAHPRLYWGQAGTNTPGNPDPAWLDLSGVNGGAPFPGWITIPSHYSLADARLWHFAFAWVLVTALTLYLGWSLIRGHLKRDLAPSLAELHPAHLWHDVMEHARLRFPTGAAALRYNILQKLAYGAVLIVLLPGVVLTGLTMSPTLNAAMPWLVDDIIHDELRHRRVGGTGETEAAPPALASRQILRRQGGDIHRRSTQEESSELRRLL